MVDRGLKRPWRAALVYQRTTHPGEAAWAVAHRGGLPLRVVRFTNSETPHGTTDFGFIGRWNGTRSLVGKAAIDCKVGKARVLSVEVIRP